MRILGYAVLESSERAGISSLNFEIYEERADADERAEWHTYADAGDTVCEVVTIVKESTR